MTAATEKIGQYLVEAHAAERALTRTLQSQIAMTPSGGYRDVLEEHLHETRDHAERVSDRLDELDQREDPLSTAEALIQSVTGQALAFAKTPLDLLRGSSREEKVLKNAKDAAATEALEIATYTALERLAHDVGDERTARLAREIRADEERMLDRILEEIPQLTGKVVAADARGESTYAVAKTGAGEAAQKGVDRVRDLAQDVRRSASEATDQVRGTARDAAGIVVDPPLPRYDSLTAEEIASRLPHLSQRELVRVDVYERAHEHRATVTDRIASLRGDEPWTGYDEQTVPEIRSALSGSDVARARGVVRYERAHKDRAGVIDAAEHVTRAA